MTTRDVRVVLPEEQPTLIEYREDGLPAIAMVNGGLSDFEHGDVFRWHLSIVIHLEDLVENGMPSEAEREIVDPFGDQLDEHLKVSPDAPNALFLARVTWSGTRELLYRVYDPDRAHEFLQSVISSEPHPREFDYRIEDDPEWKEAKWYLDVVRNVS